MTIFKPKTEQLSDIQIINDLIHQIHTQQELLARVESILDDVVERVELEGLPLDVKVHRVIQWISSGKYRKKQKAVKSINNNTNPPPQ